MLRDIAKNINDNSTMKNLLFEAHEHFIGIHAVENIKSDTLVTVLKDILIRLNIPLSNCRGQCYDGTSNMTGIK